MKVADSQNASFSSHLASRSWPPGLACRKKFGLWAASKETRDVSVKGASRTFDDEQQKEERSVETGGGTERAGVEANPQKRLTVRAGPAEARGHHEPRQDSRGGAGAEEHGAAGAVGCQKSGPIPEGDQPERAFPQNCRRDVVLVHPDRRFSHTQHVQP